MLIGIIPGRLNNKKFKNKILRFSLINNLIHKNCNSHFFSIIILLDYDMVFFCYQKKLFYNTYVGFLSAVSPLNSKNKIINSSFYVLMVTKT